MRGGDKAASGGYSGRSWRRRRSVRSTNGGGYEGRRVKDDYS